MNTEQWNENLIPEIARCNLIMECDMLMILITYDISDNKNSISRARSRSSLTSVIISELGKEFFESPNASREREKLQWDPAKTVSLLKVSHK